MGALAQLFPHDPNDPIQPAAVGTPQIFDDVELPRCAPLATPGTAGVIDMVSAESTDPSGPGHQRSAEPSAPEHQRSAPTGWGTLKERLSEEVDEEHACANGGSCPGGEQGGSPQGQGGGSNLVESAAAHGKRLSRYVGSRMGRLASMLAADDDGHVPSTHCRVGPDGETQPGTRNEPRLEWAALKEKAQTLAQRNCAHRVHAAPPASPGARHGPLSAVDSSAAGVDATRLLAIEDALSRIAAATDRIGSLEAAVAQLGAQTARIGDEMERLQHMKQP